MPAGNRKRATRSEDTRPGHRSCLDRVTQSERRITRRPQIAHRGEARPRGEQGVLHASYRRTFVTVGRFAPEGRTRIAGQMDMRIDQAGEDRFVLHVDHGCTCRGGCAGFDPNNTAIFDDNGGGAQRRLCRVDDQAAGLNSIGFGLRCGRA